MPGICGVIDSRCDAEAVALDALIAPLRPHDWFITERWENRAGTSLAAVSLDRAQRMPHLATSREEDWVCILDGEIYNACEVRTSLPAVASGDSDAALLLAGWKASGKEFLRRLNGSFSAVLVNAVDQSAVLVSDRFGNHPLYYATDGGSLRFSSRLKSLAVDPSLPREINPRGLAQFFTFGHYLRDDTSLSGVKVLPAAACCTWNAAEGRWTTDRFYSFSEEAPRPASSEAEFLAQISEAFVKSVERQSARTQNLGLSLSGGLDARSILAAIDTRRTPLQSICLGVQGSLDHRCAEQLARLAGCPNHSYVLDTGFLGKFGAHLARMVELTDGQYLSQCIVMPTLPVYRNLGIDVLLRGHGGELMHMYKAYNYSLDEEALALSRQDQLESWLFQRLQSYMLDGVERPIFAANIWADLPGLARESLRSDLEDAASIEPVPQRIWHLFLTQRLRRETVLSLNKFRSVAETRLPFLDNDLIGLLLRAPAGLKLGEKIQEFLLGRCRPDFLRVANANTGTRVGAGKWRRHVSSLMLRAMAKLGAPGYQPYERLGLWLRQELAPVVRSILLDGRTLDRGLYDPDGVRAVVDNHLANRKNHTFLIMALMIFELQQRFLFERSTEDWRNNLSKPTLARAGQAA